MPKLLERLLVKRERKVTQQRKESQTGGDDDDLTDRQTETLLFGRSTFFGFLRAKRDGQHAPTLVGARICWRVPKLSEQLQNRRPELAFLGCLFSVVIKGVMTCANNNEE